MSGIAVVLMFVIIHFVVVVICFNLLYIINLAKLSMCLSPIHVHIKRFDSCNGLAPCEYDVPCGKCWQCRESKRSAYFVRNFYEWLRCKSLGGYSIFFTLTFDNAHLPMCGNIPCNSRRVVQLFLKRIRKALTKEFGSAVADNFRYFIVPEFGEHTHRPHIHGVFYVSIKGLSPFKLHSLVEQTWQNGFIKFGDGFGVVNSPAGLAYVCKYVSKSFHDDDFLKIVHDVVSDDDYNTYFKPFVLLSRGFGLFAFDTMCSPAFRLDDSVFNNSYLSIQGKKYPVPPYYRRKFLYDLCKDLDEDMNIVPRYVLNEKGFNVHRETFNKRADSHRSMCLQLLGSDILNNDIICRLNARYHVSFNVDSFIQFINSKTDNFSSEYVYYSMIYRHLFKLPQSFGLGSQKVSAYDIEEFFDYCGYNCFSDFNFTINSDNINDYSSWLSDVFYTIRLCVDEHPDYPSINKYLRYISSLHCDKVRKQQIEKERDSYYRKLALKIIK